MKGHVHMEISFEPYVRIEYGEELESLPEIYERALAIDVSEFAGWIRRQSDRSLLAIGAGGSLAIAQIAADLHEAATGKLSRAAEPLDIFLGADDQETTAGLLVTASGGHSDSLAACQLLPSRKNAWGVFFGKEDSPGAKHLEGSHVGLFEYDLLPDLHGWVAVNALLAQVVILARAYIEAFPSRFGTLPQTITDLLPLETNSMKEASEALYELTREALSKEILILLHGTDTKAAALDIDSKFAGTGLGSIVMSEYRNFAHGRYQMMLPKQQDCGVIAIHSAREHGIADVSVKAIPNSIPAASISVSGSEFGQAAECVGSIVLLLILIGVTGDLRN